MAGDKGAWVFVVEGEKDADNLAALGLIATTNPGGAGKWKNLTDDSALHGRRVAVIPDKDRAGLAHAQDVAARLHGKAAVVKVIDLPDGEVDGRPVKDISDWVEWLDGKTAEELAAALVNMAEDAPAWTPSATGRREANATGANAQDAEEKPAQAEAIVRLALEQYRLGLTDAGEPFAVERDGPNLARVFRGGREAFRAALARDYRWAYNRTANASALADALTTLEGESLDLASEPVGLRIAEYGGGIVLDLGDSQGRAVIVRHGQWELMSSSPVLFRRTALTGAMPAPERGGHLGAR
jgi:5S rRNA maturation endonuclease (ribonuclease M5)